MKKTARIIAPKRRKMMPREMAFYKESPKFWKEVSNGIEQQIRASGAVLTRIEAGGIYVISKSGDRTLLGKGDFKSAKIQRRKFTI